MHKLHHIISRRDKQFEESSNGNTTLNPVFWRILLYPLLKRIFIVLERIAGDYALLVAIRLPRRDFWFRPLFINEWHMALGIWAKIYEPYFNDALRLTKGDVFIDVGAYTGYHSQRIAKIVGETGMVICVEANPFNICTLERNVSGFPQVKVFWAAATDRKGPIHLSLDERPVYSSSHELARTSEEANTIITVPGITIDSLVRHLKIGRKARVFMKIEVEGSELHVLRGSTKFIKRYLPTMTIRWERDLEKLKEVLPNYRFTHMFGYFLLAVPESHGPE